MSIIKVNNLSKIYRVALKQPGLKGTISHLFRRTYREIPAVRNISFKIEPGEIVGFLGANGAGKTTTLKMLTGLIYPSAGEINVAGFIPFERKKPFLTKISLVMGQKQQLLWDLPALDSLKINAAVYEIPEPIFQKRLAELSQMLSLQTKLTQPVRKLSLGERMKAELLAALLHHPPVLFLDEPTLGLDVNAQVAVRDFLREYNHRYNATILLTSHYMADITALCKRVMVINEGKLIYDGKLEALLARFAPCREIKLELAKSVSPELLSQYGNLHSIDGQVVSLLVPRENLTQTITRIINDLDILDFVVSEPPIEEIIGALFRSGRI
ncbi:MAG: ATP-binding cassette domain-containing protein [Cyanobacteria bacterium J083]|nr:MAG: ATP-binding cassette domain-containing protein [Cyanobacteria bacterium J083]